MTTPLQKPGMGNIVSLFPDTAWSTAGKIRCLRWVAASFKDAGDHNIAGLLDLVALSLAGGTAVSGDEAPRDEVAELLRHGLKTMVDAARQHGLTVTADVIGTAVLYAVMEAGDQEKRTGA